MTNELSAGEQSGSSKQQGCSPLPGRSKSDSMDDMSPSTDSVQSLWLLASCNFGLEADRCWSCSCRNCGSTECLAACSFSFFFPLSVGSVLIQCTMYMHASSPKHYGSREEFPYDESSTVLWTLELHTCGISLKSEPLHLHATSSISFSRDACCVSLTDKVRPWSKARDEALNVQRWMISLWSRLWSIHRHVF